jgi:DNA-binding MarR family transcriptional regulator
MSDESSLSLFASQVKEFIREMAFLYQELISFKDYLESEFPEDIQELKGRIELINSGESAKRTDNYDLFFRICSVLSVREDPLTMGEMSTALGVTLSMATRLVAWLVENGYVVRLSDPDDRRIVRVTLTQKGQQVFKSLNDFIAQRAGRILDQFTEEERILLILLLRKLAKNLKEQE